MDIMESKSESEREAYNHKVTVTCCSMTFWPSQNCDILFLRLLFLRLYYRSLASIGGALTFDKHVHGELGAAAHIDELDVDVTDVLAGLELAPGGHDQVLPAVAGVRMTRLVTDHACNGNQRKDKYYVGAILRDTSLG